MRKDWRRQSLGGGKVCKNKARLKESKEKGWRVKGHLAGPEDDRCSILNSRTVSEPPGSWPPLCPAEIWKMSRRSQSRSMCAG